MIEKPTRGEQPELPAGEQVRPVGNHRIVGRWRTLKLIILAAVVLIAFLGFISGLIQKGLWMGQLGYSGVFWTLLSLRWGLFCAAFAVALLYLWIKSSPGGEKRRHFPCGSLDQRVYNFCEPRFSDLSRGFETSHGHDRCCRRSDLCSDLLWPMGYISPIPIRRIL